GGSGNLAEGRDPDPCVAVRWLQLRHPARRQTGVFRPVSPRGLARPARFALFVQAVHRPDAREQADVGARPSLRGANGSRECAPDDRLRDEAIQLFLRGTLDCFACARNDGIAGTISRHLVWSASSYTRRNQPWTT